MTEEQIKLINLLNNEIIAEEKRFATQREEHQRRISHLNIEKYKAQEKCDHKHPDGSSALCSAYMYSYCFFCGQHDL